MVDCIHLLTTLLQSLSFQERLTTYNTKKSHKLYTREIPSPASETTETETEGDKNKAKLASSVEKSAREEKDKGETEFEWRVRVVYRLYSLLFPQLSSSISMLVTNLEEEEKQQGHVKKHEEGKEQTEKILSFFWRLLCTCGTGNYGTNQRNSKFERVPFSYVHEEFLVLFYEFSKDPKPSGTRTRSLTDSKRHWYKGESTGTGYTPLLPRGGDEDDGTSEEERKEGEVLEKCEKLPPTLPLSNLLHAVHVDLEQEKRSAQEEVEREAAKKNHNEQQQRTQEIGQDDSKCYTREVDLYPFQEEVLNFDNNEDPVENLRQFLRLLRGSNRAMSGYV